MKEMIKNLLLGCVLLAACADVEDVELIDTTIDVVSLDGGVESIEQASCVSPCRPVPTTVFTQTDPVTGWLPGTEGRGTFTSYGPGGRAIYTMVSPPLAGSGLAVKVNGQFNSCTATAGGGVCDGYNIACPSASAIHASETAFTVYCGDEYHYWPGNSPGLTCVGQPNGYNANWGWWSGSRPLSTRWNLASPGMVLADYLTGTGVVVWSNGKHTLECSYHVLNNGFWLDTQGP